ncbi:Hpt domain-containing protein [Methylobacterium sp. J-068]|uniref:Hpt domain-containing protein n=1 Tax=Methylobacterium sp. J-068 TaxID=2836649 RepID=UPI001FBB44A7|nr:Hpt domain-containing protein [Methylobacterium sp. J-068]MCJ2033728.1 Hpt domain-containing protein [Methylobacterium sp. J-068]
MQDAVGAALIDHEHLARQTFGDAELARDLLGLFAEQCRRLVPGILDPGLSAAERADLAHTLKGSALGVGAERIARLSASIEDALRAGAPATAACRLSDAVADTLSVLPPAS